MSHIHHHPRRQFLRKSFAFLGLPAFASAASQYDHQHDHAPASALLQAPAGAPPKPEPAPQPREKGMRLGPRQVFDAHLHCRDSRG